MTENRQVSPADAYAGLPLLYVHLSLELARQPQGLGGDRVHARHGTAFSGSSAPVREDVLLLMERILRLVSVQTIVDIDDAAPWFQEMVVQRYLEARQLLRLGERVRLMVLPCPDCDLRALVRALDAPVIRCEHCAHTMSAETYVTLSEQRRAGETAVQK